MSGSQVPAGAPPRARPGPPPALQAIPGRGQALAIVACAALAGALLRLAAARGDLWLDEIWSLHFAAAARSPLEVFAEIHHDNNHYLNTLWMMVGGEGASPLVHRLLSVGSGAGMVALGAAAALRRGRIEVAATALLLAGSRFLVHYGSEARGYGPATFFAVASYASLGEWLGTGRRRWMLAFAAAAALGILSHLTFALVLGGALAWGALELVRRKAPAADWILLTSPVVLLALLWLVDLRFLVVGGGPPYELGGVLRELSRATLGLPRGPPELLAAPFVAVAGYEVVALARERDARAAFFAVSLLLAPLALLALRRPQVLAPRYLAVLVPLFALLAGRGLARLARLGRSGAMAVAVGLVLFVAGNGVQIAALLRDGRGHYREAVALMLAGSADRAVTVGSDNDFRNLVVLGDQARRLGALGRIAYVDRASLGRRPPEWFLLHDFAERPAGERHIEVAGRPYGLVAAFPYAGLSGFSWLVYRMIDAPVR